jgi:hypothetical protein
MVPRVIAQAVLAVELMTMMPTMQVSTAMLVTAQPFGIAGHIIRATTFVDIIGGRTKRMTI